MLGTKVEITLKKAEPGNWIKLEYPRTTIDNTSTNDKTSEVAKKDEQQSDDSDVDLNSIEPVSGITITEA